MRDTDLGSFTESEVQDPSPPHWRSVERGTFRMFRNYSNYEIIIRN